MIRTRHRRALLIAIILAAGSAASAQTITWAAPSSGLWSVPANWNPQNIPDSATERAVIAPAGAYTVTADLTVTLAGLDITNPAADVRINVGRAIGIQGSSLLNDGTLTINSTAGASDTFLQFATSATLSGSGRLILNGIGNRAYVSTISGATLTHAATHTISGFGNLYASLVNDGVIAADSAGNTLTLLGAAKANNNLIKSLGGTLRVESITLTQSSAARLFADGGKVSLLSSTINGGELDSDNAGIVETASGASILNDVTNSGTVNVNVGTALAIAGTKLTNNGLITVNPAALAQDTYIQFSSSASLDGTGRLTLNGIGNRAYLSTISGVTATNASGHTIGGFGIIYATLINEGLITADVPSQTLTLTSGQKTNHSTIKASGANTILRLETVTMTQNSSGILLADAGKVSYITAALTGGTLRSANSGIHELSLASSTFADVANEGTLNILVGTGLGVAGSGLVNDGLITVNPSASASDTYILFLASGALSGSGRVVLNGVGNRAYLNTVSGVTLTHAAAHTISGYGNIYAALVNDGVIDADAPGQVLTLTSGAKTNSNLMKASAGTLRVESAVVTQGSSARLLADNAKVSLIGATITGGALQSVGSGITEVSGSASILNSVTNDGALNILANSAIVVAGSGLINNGLITINPSAAANDTFLRFNSTSTLGGSGTLTLNAVQTRSYLQTVTGVTATNGPSHTITGIGNMYGSFINQGRIAPGLPYGRITLEGTLAQHASGIMSLQIAGTAAGSTHDQFAATGPVSLAGTLDVDFASGYSPGPASTYTLLTAGPVSGQFDTLDLPALPASARVVYRPTAVELMMCYPNCDGSTGSPALTANDFTCFLTRYAAADRYANCDGSTGDPVLTANDFICYLISYAAGCSGS